METSPGALTPPVGEPISSVYERAAKDITFGSIAGVASKFVEHPFDLTKVRLQSQVLDSVARFNGPLDCLKTTWRNEGIRGLYAGLPAPIVGAMAENAILFLAYSEIQNAIRWSTGRPREQDLVLKELAVAAAGAGFCVSFVLTPIELVKCKMQVQMLIPSATGASAAPVRAPGPIETFMSVLRTQGLRGLWLGHTGTLIRETGGSAAWFSCKEAIASGLLARRTRLNALNDPGAPQRPLTKADLRAWESALSGACAGGAYNLALFPADSVKSTMQTEDELRPRPAGSPPRTFFGTARDMWRAKGIRGLYAGGGITIARSIPSSAMIFLIYDGLSRRFA